MCYINTSQFIITISKYAIQILLTNLQLVYISIKYSKNMKKLLKAISAMVLVLESSSGGLEAASDFIIALQSLIDSRWIPMYCDFILEIPSEVVYKRP